MPANPKPVNPGRRALLFAIAGGLELILGLLLSLNIALKGDWNLALLLALGFFASAQVLFYIAWQKVK